MRSHNIARFIFAVTIFGLIANSSCAPDNKRKTRAMRAPIDPAAAAATPKVVASVKKAVGDCTPSPMDPKELIGTVSAIISKATPIAFSDLPQGTYNLTSAIGNVQAHNIKNTNPAAATTGTPNNADPNLGATSATANSSDYDMYRELTITNPQSDLNQSCLKTATGGTLPGGDQGRSPNIDTYFVIDAKHNVINALEANFTVSAGTTAQGPVIEISTQQTQQSALPQNPQNRTRANMAPSALPSLINTLKTSVGSDLKYTFDASATDARGVKLTATGSAFIGKVSDNQYQIIIQFSEDGQFVPSRQLILTYNVLLTSATTSPGRGMTTPSQAAPGNTVPPAATSTATPPPTAPDNTATPQLDAAGNPLAAGNPQPPQSQQGADAAAAAAQLPPAAAGTAAAPAAQLPPAGPPAASDQQAPATAADPNAAPTAAAPPAGNQ